MSLIVKIELSESGRKAEILAGGTGQKEYYFDVPRDDPSFPALVALAKFSDGNLMIDTTRPRCDEDDWIGLLFDAAPTPAELLENEDRRRATWEAKAAQRDAYRHEQTLQVLRERQTRGSSETVCSADRLGSAIYRIVKPCWPNSADKSVLASPEATAWVAELDASNAVAQASALVEAEARAVTKREEIAAQKIADAEEAAARQKRRDELGMAAGDIELDIEDGALTQVPPKCWESHSRGKNWLAIISVDPSKPGGLDRDFAAKAHGDSYYLAPDWSIGDAVEFGADYYSGGGRKSPTRWYGFVLRILDESVILRKCDGGKDAVKAGKAFAAAQVPDAQIEEAVLRVNAEGGIVAMPSDN